MTENIAKRPAIAYATAGGGLQVRPETQPGILPRIFDHVIMYAHVRATYKYTYIYYRDSAQDDPASLFTKKVKQVKFICMIIGINYGSLCARFYFDIGCHCLRLCRKMSRILYTSLRNRFDLISNKIFAKEGIDILLYNICPRDTDGVHRVSIQSHTSIGEVRSAIDQTKQTCSRTTILLVHEAMPGSSTD